MMDDEGRLLRELAAFNVADLAAGVGGLQLLPENADHGTRLHRLAAVVARLPGDSADRPLMSAGRWRTVLNTPPLADAYWVAQEDPYEEPYTEAVPFFGGSYTAMPGVATGSVQMLRRLFHALYQGAAPKRDPLAAEMERLIRCVLWISDTAAARAGLVRGVRPVPGKGDPAIVPPGPRFAALKEAVTFSRHEIDTAVGGSSEEILAGLTFQPGSLMGTPLLEDPDRRVLSTPIVDFGDRIVVLLPTALPIALIHRVVLRSRENGALADLVLRYRDSVEGLAMRSMIFMGFRPIEPPVTSAVPPGAKEQFFQFDRDKLAQLITVTDPLDNYEAEGPLGYWDQPDVFRRIEDRIVAVRDETLAATPSRFTGVLHIIVVGGLGRTVVSGLTDRVVGERSWTISIGAHDLEIIAHREGRDPLALWRFVRASNDLRDRTKVLQFSALDEYAIYKDRDESFYMDDGALPDLMVIQSDSALELRMSYVRELDPHGVRTPDGTKIANVQRWTKDQRSQSTLRIRCAMSLDSSSKSCHSRCGWCPRVGQTPHTGWPTMASVK